MSGDNPDDTLPSTVMANELGEVINDTLKTLAGPAFIPGMMTYSVMDSIKQFTEGTFTKDKDVIENWTPSKSDSTIVMIGIRITPETRDHNDGLSQIIVCVIGVYLLNLWGLDSGKTYEMFPEVMLLEGKRSETDKNYGLIDLWKTIAFHLALTGRDVIVLARNSVRYAESPDDIRKIEIHLGDAVDERKKRNISMAIKSCTMKALNSFHVPPAPPPALAEGVASAGKKLETSEKRDGDGTISGLRRFRELEYKSEKNISAGESSNKKVTSDYDIVVSPEAQAMQEETNKRAQSIRDSLESSAGDKLRQQVKAGYIALSDTRLPDFDVHTRLNSVKSDLGKGGKHLERVVRDTIKHVRGLDNQLHSNLVNIRAISFTRRSPVPKVSDGIGESDGVTDMDGAQHLPRRQVSATVSALGVVSNIHEGIAYLHAEAVDRDSPVFLLCHAKLIVLLILSKTPLPVAVSTLVRFGAPMVIITTILEFMQQLKSTLITADCIGYDALKQAANEESRKLERMIEQSKVAETKEDIVVAELSAEKQLQHYALETASLINAMRYEGAKLLRAKVSGDILDYRKNINVSTRRARMEGGSSVMEDSMMSAAASMARGNSDSDGDGSFTDTAAKPNMVSTKRKKTTEEFNYGSDSEEEKFDAKIRGGR